MFEQQISNITIESQLFRLTEISPIIFYCDICKVSQHLEATMLLSRNSAALELLNT